MAHAGGRPPKYRKKLCEEALKLFSEGYSIVQVAAAFNVSRETIYAWGREHKEFSDTLTIGTAKAEAFWETITQAGASGANEQPVNQGLLSLIMKCRYHWTEKQDVSISGDMSVKVADLTPEERKEKVKQIIDKYQNG